MSRSGLLRAAALLAAGAAPLLAGSANAAEALPSLPGVPEVGADKIVSDAGLPANPLESAGALKLGQVTTPVTPDGKTPAVPVAAQERTAPNPVVPRLGTLPSLPNAGGLKAPSLSDLPTNGIVPNPNVLSGTLPTING